MRNSQPCPAVPLTAREFLPDDSPAMSTLTTELPRRSARVFRRVRINVSGRNGDGRRFHEKAQTIVVNAHGGLMYLTQSVELEATLVVANPSTDEELECRVVYLGDIEDRGQRVG